MFGKIYNCLVWQNIEFHRAMLLFLQLQPKKKIFFYRMPLVHELTAVCPIYCVWCDAKLRTIYFRSCFGAKPIWLCACYEWFLPFNNITNGTWIWCVVYSVRVTCTKHLHTLIHIVQILPKTMFRYNIYINRKICISDRKNPSHWMSKLSKKEIAIKHWVNHSQKQLQQKKNWWCNVEFIAPSTRQQWQ